MKKLKYNSTIDIKSVSLNVFDIEKQTKFYEEIIGLEVVNKTDSEVQLGVEGNVLLKLYKVANFNKLKEAALFHVAFLFPTREDLGAMFRHLITKQVPLQGASDHVYSEAIYLEDVEGNGIELYADRPEDVWERDSAGRPIGKTFAMDSEGVLSAGAHIDINNYKMPNGTIIGHVHLSVIDVAKTTTRYQQFFPMEDKMTLPIVSFIAGGDYHHHFAFNNWGYVNSPKTDGEVGLRNVDIELTNKEEYNNLLEVAVEDMKVTKYDDYLEVTDIANGIKINVFWSSY